MSEKEHDTWFPAKTYGWGWGFPIKWQGWVVLAVYLVLLLGGIAWLDERISFRWGMIYVAGITVALVAICWAKGEKPRWRWGK